MRRTVGGGTPHVARFCGNLIQLKLTLDSEIVMQSVTLQLETVTPLFLNGANARGEPELRPPAFRGAMRYWLRALLGGLIGDDSNLIYQAESKIFGSTDAKLGGGSSISLRISFKNLPSAQTYQKRSPITISKNGKAIKQPVGYDYLFWTLGASGSHERNNRLEARQYLPSGGPFDLILSIKPCKDYEIVTKQSLAALWLLIMFGGIGSRSRRTAGSLTVATPFEYDGLSFQLDGNLAQIRGQLESGISQIREWIVRAAHPLIHKPSAFDVLHPDYTRIWLLGKWNNANDAIEAIGASLRDFRTYREPDHTEVYKWLKGNSIKQVERAVFGLPIPYRYSDGTKGTIQGQTRKPTIERRSSPVWLKVSRTKDNQYIGVATLFKSQFLPSNEELHIKNVKPTVAAPNDFTLIENWIETFSHAQEVNFT